MTHSPPSQTPRAALLRCHGPSGLLLLPSPRVSVCLCVCVCLCVSVRGTGEGKTPCCVVASRPCVVFCSHGRADLLPYALCSCAVARGPLSPPSFLYGCYFCACLPPAVRVEPKKRKGKEKRNKVRRARAERAGPGPTVPLKAAPLRRSPPTAVPLDRPACPCGAACSLPLAPARARSKGRPRVVWLTGAPLVYLCFSAYSAGWPTWQACVRRDPFPTPAVVRASRRPPPPAAALPALPAAPLARARAPARVALPHTGTRAASLFRPLRRQARAPSYPGPASSCALGVCLLRAGFLAPPPLPAAAGTHRS